jgi:hypothetical protein
MLSEMIEVLNGQRAKSRKIQTGYQADGITVGLAVPGWRKIS